MSVFETRMAGRFVRPVTSLAYEIIALFIMSQ